MRRFTNYRIYIITDIKKKKNRLKKVMKLYKK